MPSTRWSGACLPALTTLIFAFCCHQYFWSFVSKALWQKKWTNFAKLACHFPGNHHLILNYVWELLHVLPWWKVGYSLSSQMTATERGNLKTMDEVIGQFFLLNYSLGTNFTVKPFKQLGVAKSTISKVFQNVENWGAHRKTTCKWMACSEARQREEKAACQCGHG